MTPLNSYFKTWEIVNIKRIFGEISMEQLSRLSEKDLLSIDGFGLVRVRRFMDYVKSQPIKRIPVRQTCALCGKIYKMDFWVPDEVWKLAMPTYHHNSLCCFECFTTQADERLIPWDEYIQILKFYSLSSHIKTIRHES